MDKLNFALERELNGIASLKSDLSNVESLLQDNPVDPDDIIASVEQRERQMDELQEILPKLAMFDTHRISQRCKSLSNDQLFKALVSCFEEHNKDLNVFKKRSSEEIKGKRDLTKKANELTRIALKQHQLNSIQKQILKIQESKEDRQLQKALLGTLFIWFEKANTNLIPAKSPEQKVQLPSLEQEILRNTVPHSTRNLGNAKLSPLRGRQAQQSVAVLGSADKRKPLGKARNFSHTPLIPQSESSRNMMARRGTSVVARDAGLLLSPSDSSGVFKSDKKFHAKRNSQLLPTLPSKNRFSARNHQQSLASTQIDSVDQKKFNHQPQIKRQSTVSIRMQQNRPKLKIGELDKNSDLSDIEIKSPNFVVQPMALGPDQEEEATPLLGQQEEGMLNRREGSMLQGETQQSMHESNQFDAYKFSLDAPIGIHENTVRSEQEDHTVLVTPGAQMEKQFNKIEREQVESPMKLPSLLPPQDKMIKTQSSAQKQERESMGQSRMSQQNRFQSALKQIEEMQKESLRAHQMSSKLIDLTHDTVPEKQWRPIQKTFDRVPPQAILMEKVPLREWEVEQQNEHLKFFYDRRDLDIDVFRKFQANGEIIKMTIDARDLTKDKNFWKNEAEIQEKAQYFINTMKRQKPYDLHAIQPLTYDLKMLGDPNRGGQKKKSSKEMDKKKADAAKKQKKKTAQKMGSEGAKYLDEIEEEVVAEKDSEEEDSDDVPEDKYDPLAKQKEGGPKLKKQSMLQSAVEQTALELGKAMPVMSRGPELELSTIKDVEDLKHTLAQAMIHVPNDVLRRAIILPKDVDTSNGKYPTPQDLLPRNPLFDVEYIQKQEEQAKVMKDLIKWQQKTFPWRRKAVVDEDGEPVKEVNKKKKKQ